MNLELKATRQITTIYPQMTPVLSKLRLVLRPDRTKYYATSLSIASERRRHEHTRGRKVMDTRSSSFSTMEIAKPLSCGMISPARKPPKQRYPLTTDGE